MTYKTNHEKLFPEDEQIAEELSKLVDEGVILQLINIYPGITMNWGRQVRTAYGISDEIEQYYEALEFGVKPKSVREVDKEDGYDVDARNADLSIVQIELISRTLMLNKRAAEKGLSPVLANTETMSNDDIIRCLYAYYEARIKKKELGKYESLMRRRAS